MALPEPTLKTGWWRDQSENQRHYFRLTNTSLYGCFVLLAIDQADVREAFPDSALNCPTCAALRLQLL